MFLLFSVFDFLKGLSLGDSVFKWSLIWESGATFLLRSSTASVTGTEGTFLSF